MNENIEEKIRNVFETIFPECKNDFDWKREQEDYENWYSLSHLDLTSELEKKLEIQFEPDEVISISSAHTALEIILKMKNDNS